MAVLGLSFCARAFSSCGKWGPLFIAVRGPFSIAAPPVAGHRLQTCRLSNCGPWAQLLRGMWDLPRPGLEPVSPALAGRFSTTAPPGKPFFFFLILKKFIFGCVGSSLLCVGFSLVVVSRGYSSLQCTGLSLWWLLLLWAQALGTQASVAVAPGLSSGAWALECKVSSCGMWA